MVGLDQRIAGVVGPCRAAVVAIGVAQSDAGTQIKGHDGVFLALLQPELILPVDEARARIALALRIRIKAQGCSFQWTRSLLTA